MAVIGVAAKRYAEALFGVAVERGAGTQCLADLQAFWTQVTRVEPLRNALLSPAVPSDAASRVVTRVARSMGMNEATIAFLALLGSRRRMGQVPGIIAAYADIQDRTAGRARGELVSAGVIAPGQVLRVREAISHALKRTLLLSQRIDPGLLGGFRVTVGDRVYDLSVRSYLDSLRSRVVANR